MFVSGRASYHFAAKDAAAVPGAGALVYLKAKIEGAPSAASAPALSN